MKIKRSILTPTIVAVIALATGGWFLQQGVSQERNVYVQARLFEDVLHRVADHFVEEAEPDELYQMAIDGMLRELGDPHSVFMTPDDYEDLALSTRGEYGGLGIQIDIRDDWVTVISPLPGTPAERAGLRAGDKIVEVDGESTRGWSSDRAVQELRGARGTAVDLRIARIGVDEPIPFRVTRADIRLKAVPSSYMLDDRVGYLELAMFSETTTDEVRDAIDGLRGEGMRGLVLDLRPNPGGLLDQGVSVTDLFLDRGQMIVEMRSRDRRNNQVINAVRSAAYPDLPVVVLVGRGSASASEIVAGALQDHDRALVLGETTFGKGSVQSLFPLPGDNHLKLTTARWFTPIGRSIQKPYGIDGNREEVQDSTEITFQTDGGRTVYGGGGIRPDLIVRPDTASSAEREFLREQQQFGSAYRNVLFEYAVEYKDANPNLRRDFQVTSTMLDDFYQRLDGEGIEIERSLYDGASDWVSRDLAIEISYAVWGQDGARRRANTEDTQVSVAAELLRESTSPGSVFTLADRYREQYEHVMGAAADSVGAEGVHEPF